MSTISFLMASLDFSMYSSMASANCDSFTYSFPIWIPFLSFSCLISVTRSSNTMLSESGERGHLCLVSDLRGTFGFSPFKFYLFICFWLFWVFSAMHGLSLVAVSGSCSLLHCAGFSLQRLLSWSTGSRHMRFSSSSVWPQKLQLKASRTLVQ